MLKRNQYLSEIEAVAACAVYHAALTLILETTSGTSPAAIIAENALKEIAGIFGPELPQVASNQLETILDRLKQAEKDNLR